MGLSSIGIPGLIIILVIILVLFGPRKLPEIGSAVGKTLAEFKKSTREIMEEEAVTKNIETIEKKEIE